MQNYLFSGRNPKFRDLQRAYKSVRETMIDELELCGVMVKDDQLREWDDEQADTFLQMIAWEQGLSLEYIMARRWADHQALKNKRVRKLLQNQEAIIARAFEIHEDQGPIELLAYHVRRFFVSCWVMVDMWRQRFDEGVQGIGGTADAGTEAPA